MPHPSLNLDDRKRGQRLSGPQNPISEGLVRRGCEAVDTGFLTPAWRKVAVAAAMLRLADLFPWLESSTHRSWEIRSGDLRELNL